MITSLPIAGRWQFFHPILKRYFAAEVPGCIHTDLRRNDLIPDPFWGSNELQLQWIEEEDWKYVVELTPDEKLFSADHIELVADGLDTVATVKLNGRVIGETENMFVAHRFDVKKSLRRGSNTLEVLFTSPTKYTRERKKPDHYAEWCDPIGGASLIRKQQCSFGWDWGCRFATSGIWLPIRLEAWSGNRIESVGIRQKHSASKVEIEVLPRLASSSSARITGRISYHGEVVAEIVDRKATIRNPKLWWPNGHGEQPLYDIEVELCDGQGNTLDVWKKRIGLRTIILDCHPDKYGESFQFVVNGRAIFAKGANWVPAHSFVAGISKDDYDNLLSSAAEAHMNMLRVWGGGIYEKEDFYDLCDEKGLLVWHDFMFACALYPGEKAFLKSVRAESEYQVKRLAHRACLALWCGNNEMEYAREYILKKKKTRKAYEDIFYKLLPQVVKECDGVTAYWESSPHNSKKRLDADSNNDDSGDAHFWDVWFKRVPARRYEEMQFRFCSEFGMQSYSSPEVAATYCKPEDFNVFSPTMENHQKNGSGNQIILDYVSRRYRFPKDYASLAYLSQLNQAYCMKTGIEHFRRSMPRTMGALYWQLNDCWPVFSWSSLEFGGKWKALHFEAKRFFAPLLVSAFLVGNEVVGKNNTLSNTIRKVDLHTVSDIPKKQSGILSWTVYHIDGRILHRGKQKVALNYGESKMQKTLDLSAYIQKHGAANLYVRIEVKASDGTIAENTVLPASPRFMELPKEPITFSVREISDKEFAIKFESAVFHHQVHFEIDGIPRKDSDNYFDLFPREAKEVRVRTFRPSSAEKIGKHIAVHSLVHTY